MVSVAMNCQYYFVVSVAINIKVIVTPGRNIQAKGQTRQNKKRKML